MSRINNVNKENWVQEKIFSLALFTLFTSFTFSFAADTAVLLLAHGGSRRWDQEISKVQKVLARQGYAVEIALGMADASSIEKALKKLEAKKPKRVVVVPLLVNSNSELYGQFQFVLGKSSEPAAAFVQGMRAAASAGRQIRSADGRGRAEGAHQHNRLDARVIKTKLALEMTTALDDHPYVAQILLSRAMTLSRDPAKEAVVLISHGPYTDEAEPAWMDIENRLAGQLAALGGFAEVKAFDLRDDSPRAARESCRREIRAYVRARSKEGKRILVLPHLIAINGIEKHIAKALEGLFYKMSKEALLPHPLIAEWALSQVKSHE